MNKKISLTEEMWLTDENFSSSQNNFFLGEESAERQKLKEMRRSQVVMCFIRFA